MKMLKYILFALLICQYGLGNENISDQYPQSDLYYKPTGCIQGLLSALGDNAQPTYEDTSHTNN